MTGGFLSRWSKKKLESRSEVAKSERVTEGEQEAAREPEEVSPAVTVAPPPSMDSASTPAEPHEPEPPLPPIESLTPESDFRPFLKPDVDPALKNQALKALFKDPHFNVMDGLDIYIDDYSKPDPLPESMLRQLTQAKMLKLFDEEERQAEAPAATEAPPVSETPRPAEKLGQNDAMETKCPTSTLPVAIETHPTPKKSD